MLMSSSGGVELLLIRLDIAPRIAYPTIAFKLSTLAFCNHHQSAQLASILIASMAKSDSQKRAELMAKE